MKMCPVLTSVRLLVLSMQQSRDLTEAQLNGTADVSLTKAEALPVDSPGCLHFSKQLLHSSRDAY